MLNIKNGRLLIDDDVSFKEADDSLLRLFNNGDISTLELIEDEALTGVDWRLTKAGLVVNEFTDDISGLVDMALNKFTLADQTDPVIQAPTSAIDGVTFRFLKTQNFKNNISTGAWTIRKRDGKAELRDDGNIHTETRVNGTFVANDPTTFTFEIVVEARLGSVVKTKVIAAKLEQSGRLTFKEVD